MSCYIAVSGELYHHGIKGQKWGVRRFQNPDGTRTAAGKRRYAADVGSAQKRIAKAESDYSKARNAYARNQSNAKLRAQVIKTSKEARWAKKDLESEKIKEKLNQETKKSKHRENLEAKYREKGMSEEEAAVAAYKRVKTEKIIAGVAGVTVAALATYGAYKYWEKNVDKTIKMDTPLSRISRNDNQGVQDAFYAAFKKSDKTKYMGMLANESSFKKTLQLTGNMKVASEKTGRNMLSDMLKNNPQVKNDLENRIKSLNGIWGMGMAPKQAEAIRGAYDDLKKGKTNSKSLYDAFNLLLVDHDASYTKKFYENLKSKGYDAIGDINDKRLSGYNSKAPLIVFNASKVKVSQIEKVRRQDINLARHKLSNDEIFQSVLKQSVSSLGAVSLGGTVGYTAKKVSASKRNDRIVAEYRKEHPNTKLSYNEILKNEEGL